MTTMTANQYELGPEQQVEAKVSAAFAKLSPVRRPREPEVLAHWLGQLVGWPGHEFFSTDRRLVDQEKYAAALIHEIAHIAEELVRVTGRGGSVGDLWALLCDRVSEDELVSSEVYLKQLVTLLPWLAEPPRFQLEGQPRKTGRPERDLFAMVPIRVVCAYLIYVEGYAPPVRVSSKTETNILSETAPDVGIAIASKQRPPFPRQHAAYLALNVLGALGMNTVADIDSLIRYALAEPWTTADDEFSWWHLLPKVARPVDLN
ncbi:hypothetical protein C8J47_0127 [Sphingomonas sp. PP-F2F-G114-C0414]|uniref:hypothetical protein n=1 Tax=Sphingomonas sp. PP-F2F-G114-C0414 TaxID=2135662 RepID=UPI000EF8E1A5|nr:hypothetical protein [Sphingomonas sp. PP-F2F-G114-C0414]RMB39164.1 hypothetical protein C8J47_0127 [Sphingomonas sp. PP-F2F-G114-C0414]